MTSFDPERRDLLKLGVVTGGAVVMRELWPSAPADAAQAAARRHHRAPRLVGAYGVGRIVNPKLARSQCVGGMIGGIGMALMEHSVVDPNNGRVPNANFGEYPCRSTPTHRAPWT